VQSALGAFSRGGAVKIATLGHLVLKVKDLARSEAFYCDLLGIQISVRTPGNNMTFLTLGSHHELALLESSDSEADGKTLGVDHFAFKLDGGLAELAAAKHELEQAGHAVAPIDHVVTKSLYFRDPDGNKVELYVDGADWRNDPKLIYSMKGLEL
jgi:catechol 2,3-dioxygenase